MSDIHVVTFNLSRGAADRLRELTEGATGDAAVAILERKINPAPRATRAPATKKTAAKKAPVRRR